jgi:hypothetical protein
VVGAPDPKWGEAIKAVVCLAGAIRYRRGISRLL